jgi:deoxyribodipyrimidine photolyase-like uncharacterized protein
MNTESIDQNSWIRVSPFLKSPQICKFSFQGTVEKCRDMIINFLNQHSIKFQIRQDGLIKCKSSLHGSLISLKFKIELCNMTGSAQTMISFTHQQGSLNSFEDIIRMAQTESISTTIKTYGKETVACHA